MDVLCNREFSELLEPVASPRVSIYLPTHVGGLETRQDALKLKNLLTMARERLQRMSDVPESPQEFFVPAQNLLEDKTFWGKSSRGLAIFLCPGRHRFYRLPVSFDESVTVGEKFYIRPLLPVVETNLFAHLLTLSQGRVRLYRVAQHAIDEVQVADLPHDISEALNYTSVERGEQVHAAGRVAERKQSGVFHGQGGKPEAKKQDLKSFCATVDRAVCRHLQTEETPLVLACVEYLEPIYREVSKYPRLIGGFVQGNPDRLSDEAIHKNSWALLEPVLNGPRNEALKSLSDRMGSNEFTNDVYRILPAAHQGQIDTLFLDDRRKLWGSYREKEQVVDVHDNVSPGDEDLLELAAVQTLRHRGHVYPLAAEQLPTPAPIAALLRYSHPSQE